MSKKVKEKPLAELTEIARQATREALTGRCIPEEIRCELVLGTYWDGDYRLFELYVPGEKPEDARVISKARVHAVTGAVVVDTFL